MTTSPIVTLAKEVEANTTKFNEYLERNNLPQPSFDIDTPLMYQLPPDIAASQENLTAALDEFVLAQPRSLYKPSSPKQ